MGKAACVEAMDKDSRSPLQPLHLGQKAFKSVKNIGYIKKAKNKIVLLPHEKRMHREIKDQATAVICMIAQVQSLVFHSLHAYKQAL